MALSSPYITVHFAPSRVSSSAIQKPRTLELALFREPSNKYSTRIFLDLVDFNSLWLLISRAKVTNYAWSSIMLIHFSMRRSLGKRDAMKYHVRLRGRLIFTPDIELIRSLIKEHCPASRAQICRILAQTCQLRQPNGRLKDRACRRSS